MPRYRVGDSYLSEEEYAVHTESKESFWLVVISFILAVLASGYNLKKNFVELDIMYITAIAIGAGVLCSSLCYALRKVIFGLLGLAFAAGFLVIAFKVIYWIIYKI